MRATLLLFLAAAAAAWLGSRAVRTTEAARQKAEVIELRLGQIEKESNSIQATHALALQNARAELESLLWETNALQRELQEQSKAQIESAKNTQIQEASATRAQRQLSPALRSLLEPAPTDTAPAAFLRRQAESLFLRSMIECGVSEIDYLALAEHDSSVSSLRPQIRSLATRFRGSLTEISNVLSRQAGQGTQTLPHRIERIEIRSLPVEKPDAKPSFLVDLHWQVYLPNSGQ